MPKPRLVEDNSERVRALALIGVLKITLAGAIAAAAWRSGWGTVAALVVSLAVEIVVARASRPAVGAMRRVNAGPPVRNGLRMLAVVLLAGRCLSSHELVGSAVAAGLVTGIAVAVETAQRLVVRGRRLPLLTRNIDLGDVSLPAPPPGFVMDPRGWDALGPIFAALGLTVAIHHNGSTSAVAVGLIVSAVVAALPLALLAPHALTAVGGGMRTRMTDAATAAIGALAPEVLLYFAATPEELYQVRMWLEPLRNLEVPTAVVVRSHRVFEALSDVSVPLICTPFNGVIASLPLPPRVAGLFVTHSGNNLSLIRRPEVRSVFVGHGDSDKPDSVNPFARVYDEVWVAGSLGRQRYARAGVGVADSAVVEVGRPQVAVAASRETEPPTIVYAPTWEGWGDDPHHSSLVHVGVALVETLAARRDVQIRYRPHPLTGRRSSQLRAAHQHIRELVGQVPPDEPLAETFAGSSGLVGDVSSVINEYLAYDRPYAVVDTRGIGRSGFVERFPSTVGGFVLPSDLDGLDEFVAAVLGGADAHRTARRELLATALGDPATAQRRFAAAVDRLLST